MATYAYKALDLQGAPAKGEIDGDDKQAVASNLRAKGLIVLDIEERIPKSAGDILARFKKVKSQELTVMTRQLSTMVSSGMSLLRALYVLEDQAESDKLKETLVLVRKDVEAGISLSDALSKHPETFNEHYVAMVAAGETGGILENTLKRIADQLEKDEELRRQVKSAMVYPSLIGGFALIVLVALVAFLVPVFAGVFEDFGGELPAITKFTVGLSDFITGMWYIAIALAWGVVFGFRKWKRTEAGKMQWDTLRLKAPFKIGETVQKISLARWSRTFSALYAAGVPIMQAIEVTGQTSGYAVVERAMEAVIESVQSGGSIAAPLRESAVFPAMVAQMIAVGEETGGLDTMLSKVADFYEDEVAAAVKALTSILEPIMIVFVGGIVGFIVVAMYMPMFKVYDSIQ